MALKMVGERNTWRLLGSLFYERLNNEDNGGEEPMIDTTKDRTDKAIISQLYGASSFLREVCLFRKFTNLFLNLYNIINAMIKISNQ